ncbi:chemotaxis protein CheW [Lichenicola sp.]|uniref:chemotaxis protein CheW n=1 Tax=Lichenicola sp. TaxID=2804529 RepID=UPI003AFFE682
MNKNLHLVTLGLGHEIFAVPVSCVTEIVAMRALFRLPDAPGYLAGLADVRGQAVPIIDLRCRLGLPPTEITYHTRIIVLEIPAGDHQLIVGLIADRVIEVITLDAGQIGPPPDIGAPWGSGCISGIGRHAEGFVIIFNMESLFSGDVITHLSPVASERAA